MPDELELAMRGFLEDEDALRLSIVSVRERGTVVEHRVLIFADLPDNDLMTKNTLLIAQRAGLDVNNVTELEEMLRRKGFRVDARNNQAATWIRTRKPEVD